MITIPADAVLRLREALYSQLGDVAEELATVDRRPRADREQRNEWAEPVASFDRTRLLLDEIGWCDRDPERGAEIDLNQHRQIIKAALSADLDAEQYLMAEQGHGAEKQRQRARGHILTIESFMTAAGLEQD
jgi:hypothetical protein